MTEKPATRTSGEDWDKKAKELLMYIRLTISQNQYGYIWDSTDGPNAWKALANIYEKNSHATCISLKRQSYGNQHDEMHPIADYITVRATPKSNSVDNVWALPGDATVFRKCDQTLMGTG